ncbi:MAG: 4'-phosphopantetheinyl transferase superfamily protein [Defluviitaleaceae bacterium]|nr:4'-phosphopantetheinyl transferase superfamily protein [Defluviitaleaceae bacterium]
MIYLYEHNQIINNSLIERLIQNMPKERQEKALKYKKTIDRDFCAIGYWLLCKGLKNEYNIIENLQLDYSKYGKPSLSAYPEIHFNISHCDAGVACVVSTVETGIDMQDIRPYNPAVARRVCTAEEMEQLEKSKNPEILFCKLWTIKESSIKMCGASLACMENKDSADWLISQAPGYVYMYWGENYHLCCFGTDGKIEFIRDIA